MTLLPLAGRVNSTENLRIARFTQREENEVRGVENWSFDTEHTDVCAFEEFKADVQTHLSQPSSRKKGDRSDQISGTIVVESFPDDSLTVTILPASSLASLPTSD